MSEAKQTPLFDEHKRLGAKMVNFGGFEMPVAYGSIIDEHKAVRNRAGIFDVSHMGDFEVTGAGARAFVNGIVTNNIARLKPGRLQYTAMCRENGGVVDDLLVLVVSDERIVLVVNASNIDKDFEHVSSFARRGVTLKNVSDDYSLLAVQGPRVYDVLAGVPFLTGVMERVREIDYYQGFTFDSEGDEFMVTRTGYTGELGFEIFMPNGRAVACWRDLMTAGESVDMAPVGLGARDTLRFEAAYCLYGHELDEETTPLEAGLGWVVKFKKDDYCGKSALQEQRQAGVPRKLVGLELDSRLIARQGYGVRKDGASVGKVTSGAFSPTLGKSLCMALVKADGVGGEGQYEVEVRNKVIAAKPVDLPFYPSRSKSKGA